MGEVLIIDGSTIAQNTLRALVTRHFAKVSVRVVDSRFAVESLILHHASLVIYVNVDVKDINMELISDIRFVSGRTPLLLYGRLLQMEDVALDLLKLGINGFLSIDASADEHFVAIDAVMRGDTYMDSRLKAHVVTALLPRSHRTG